MLEEVEVEQLHKQLLLDLVVLEVAQLAEQVLELQQQQEQLILVAEVEEDMVVQQEVVVLEEKV
jgi:hypothetical protein